MMIFLQEDTWRHQEMLLILIAHDLGSPCKICLGFSVENPASCSLSIQIKKHFLIAYHLYLLQDCNLRISISYPPTPERFLLLIVCSFIMHKKKAKSMQPLTPRDIRTSKQSWEFSAHITNCARTQLGDLMHPQHRLPKLPKMWTALSGTRGAWWHLHSMEKLIHWSFSPV